MKKHFIKGIMYKNQMKKRILAAMLGLAMAIAPVTEVNAAQKITVKEIKVIGDEEYDSYSFFENSVATIIDEKVGFIYKDGTEVECKFDGLSDFSEGMAVQAGKAKDGVYNEKAGYIDKNGKVIVECKYDSAEDFSNGMGRVKKNGKYGFVNKNGEEVVPCKYDSAEDFLDGMAIVTKLDKNGFTKYGFVNKNGKEVVKCKYDAVDDFSEGMAAVRKNGKWGYVNKSGKEVIKCKYGNATNFDEGVALVWNIEDSNICIIDKKGKVKKTLHGYGSWSMLYDGMARVCKDDGKRYAKFGYINTKGKELVPCKYDDGGDFSDGVAWVKKNGKYGYVNKKGKEIAPCKYDRVFIFTDGMGVVWKNGKHGYVNKKGKEVVMGKYDSVSDFSEGIGCVGKQYKYGYIDRNGKELIECQFDSARDFVDGTALAMKDNHLYLLTLNTK